MRTQDRHQREADAEMRTIREQRDKVRKRAAFRILDDGGTVADAARAAQADERTVKRWMKTREAALPTQHQPQEKHMPNQHGIKTLGEIGYEAYGEHAGPGGPYTTFDGRPMPKWSEFSNSEAGRLTQARWETAGQAIKATIEERNRPSGGRAITPSGVGA